MTSRQFNTLVSNALFAIFVLLILSATVYIFLS